MSKDFKERFQTPTYKTCSESERGALLIITLVKKCKPEYAFTFPLTQCLPPAKVREKKRDIINLLKLNEEESKSNQDIFSLASW